MIENETPKNLEALLFLLQMEINTYEMGFEHDPEYLETLYKTREYWREQLKEKGMATKREDVSEIVKLSEENDELRSDLAEREEWLDVRAKHIVDLELREMAKDKRIAELEEALDILKRNQPLQPC